jgi:hypothetical protein
MRLPVQKLIKLSFMGVCHQSVYVVIFMLTSYSEISSWQDMWTNTQDKNITVSGATWQSFSFIRKEEIMLRVA